jgi:hypothetical protein
MKNGVEQCFRGNEVEKGGETMKQQVRSIIARFRSTRGLLRERELSLVEGIDKHKGCLYTPRCRSTEEYTVHSRKANVFRYGI